MSAIPALIYTLTAQFNRCYGRPPARIARAPGRVNLIGEHTDYNDGFVLPMALGCATYVAAAPRADRQVNIIAADMAWQSSSFALDAPISPAPDAPWSNYVRGMAAGLLAHGVPLRGADLMIMGDVPQGAGLSSSASLEMAAGYALVRLAGGDVDRTTLARIGQQAEHDFAGCNCGVMDQLVSARGVAGHALHIDCRSLDARAVPLPADAIVLIVHSGQTRGLVDGDYNTRRAQCQAAAAHYRVPALRDLDGATLDADRAGLDALSYRRARHVVTENARTLEAADCLTRNDMPRLGALMAASHASMRDDFEITTPVIDGLVGLLQSAIGAQGGARMTGGGFGGAVVAIMPQSLVSAVTSAVHRQYKTPAGARARVMVAAPSAGVSIIPGTALNLQN